MSVGRDVMKKSKIVHVALSLLVSSVALDLNCGLHAGLSQLSRLTLSTPKTGDVRWGILMCSAFKN